jgi:rhodanese-related sulfurtransferase
MYPKPMLDFEISPSEVASRLRADPASLILLDVREPWECAIAKINGAKYMPMQEVPSRVFVELDPSEHIVAICHSGVRSMNVTVWLRNQGFESVQSMRGGIDAWSREVDPTVPRY